MVIGGGPTGVEMAGAIAEIARQALGDEFDAIAPQTARVLLLEGGPTILPELRRVAAGLGAGARSPASASRCASDAAVTARRCRMRCRSATSASRAGTVVWAAGVQASPAGPRAGRRRSIGSGRVEVRARSVAARPSRGLRRRRPDAACSAPTAGRCPGVAQAAMQSGRAAAQNVQARARRPRRPCRSAIAIPATWRRLAAPAPSPISAGSALTGYPAWLAWLFLHLVFLIGFKNRMVVLVQWLVAYVSRQRGVRLITGREM